MDIKFRLVRICKEYYEFLITCPSLCYFLLKGTQAWDNFDFFHLNRNLIRPWSIFEFFWILFLQSFARFSMLEHFRGDWAYKLSKFEWQAIKIWIVMKSCEGALAGKGLLFPLIKHGEPRQYSSLPMLSLCMHAGRQAGQESTKGTLA